MASKERLTATLDPISLAGILYSFSALILLQTLTQNVSYPGLDLYIKAGALGLLLALILLVVQATQTGAPIIGPVTKPNTITFLRQKLEGRILAPLISTGVALFIIIFGDFFFTQYTFLPSITFWQSITPKIFYSAGGGVIETILFSFLPVLLLLIVARPLIENKWLFFFVVAPILSIVAVIYHGYAYAGSPKAQSMIFLEFYAFNSAYRGSKLLLWIVMGIHGFVDIVASP